MKSILLLLLLLDVATSGSMVMAQSPGTFTPTGNLTTARQFHTATLLPNGRVLIAGGPLFYPRSLSGQARSCTILLREHSRRPAA